MAGKNKQNIKQELGEAKASQTRHCRIYKWYIVTITYNPREFISKVTLDIKHRDIILKTRKYNSDWSDNIGYELKRGTLHMHTIASFERSPWYQPSKNWNVQFKPFPIEDYDNVVSYINKQSQHPIAIEQREYESYYANNNMIIDNI